MARARQRQRNGKGNWSYAPSMVGSYSSTKCDWISWIVRHDLPTPPPPTTTSLYSLVNCSDTRQPRKRLQPAAGKGFALVRDAAIVRQRRRRGSRAEAEQTNLVGRHRIGCVCVWEKGDDSDVRSGQRLVWSKSAELEAATPWDKEQQLFGMTNYGVRSATLEQSCRAQWLFGGRVEGDPGRPSWEEKRRSGLFLFDAVQ